MGCQMCVSAQSECAVIKLAEAVKETQPLLADFFVNGRFVDDLSSSAESIETLKQLSKEADEVFPKLVLDAKDGHTLEVLHQQTLLRKMKRFL